MIYRSEIDGLRAIAVLPVILFHAGYSVFSGGYVGVDIFFVISGYLITTIILNELKTNSFSIKNFYERRARRILPALYFVIIFFIPIGWMTMPPALLENFGQSITATILFANNILLYITSGYWGAAAEFKPLLHTWSLAIEEQYYVLFPIFLLLTWRFGIKTIVLLLILIFLLSLSLAHVGAYSSPNATFFLIHTRLWEIMLGAFCAFYLINKPTPKKNLIYEILSIFGLILILFSVFKFDYSTPSPSLFTLIPTVGTALIIIFGIKDTLINKIFSVKIIVGIGLISYSTYLWHQSIFTFYRIESIFFESNKFHMPILICLSICMGYFSWRYVEKPFRNKERFSSNTIFTGSIGLAVIISLVGIFFHINEGNPDRLKHENLVLVNSSEYDRKCESLNSEGNFKACIYGSERSIKPSLAIIGDSHAQTLVPALTSISKKNNSSFVVIYLGGCPPLIGVTVEQADADRQKDGCLEFSKKQLNYVKKHKIKNVILAARWSLYTSGDYTGHKKSHFLTSENRKEISKKNTLNVFEENLGITIKTYQNVGSKVSILFQVPQHKYPIDYLYYQMKLRKVLDQEAIIEKNSISFLEHINLQSDNRKIINNLKRKLDFNAINADQIFCTNESKCLFGTKDISYYDDDDHISEEGSIMMEPLFLQTM
jgi:peptidoglycan/LPS O-acetylase OafA/YrhL